jgi:hypothetical protein
VAVVAIGDRFGDASRSRDRWTASGYRTEPVSGVPDVNSGIGERRSDLRVCRRL